MNSILLGLVVVAVGAIAYWAYLSIKAVKDPDVQAASSLKMSITRFHNYQKLYDEYQAVMLKHGVHSAAAERKFAEIFKQIDNPNEWRRYQAYREQKQRMEFMSEIYKHK